MSLPLALAAALALAQAEPEQPPALLERLETLERRQREGESSRAELAEEVARLGRELEALRTEAEEAEEAEASRLEREALFEEALATLVEADVILERGSFDADVPLARADALLSRAIGLAGTGAPREVELALAAQGSIAAAKEALGRRDFQEARFRTQLAFLQVRHAQAVTRSAPSPLP